MTQFDEGQAPLPAWGTRRSFARSAASCPIPPPSSVSDRGPRAVTTGLLLGGEDRRDARGYVETKVVAMATDDVSITAYGRLGDAEAFTRLNLEWLEELFVVEDDDRHLLGNPETSILAPGGHILVARQSEKVIGVCALIRIDQTAYELAKMAVDKSMRGRGIGRKLLAATVAYARDLGAEMLLINTNTKLANAIHLYRDAGFLPSNDARQHRYGRSDVFLELRL